MDRIGSLAVVAVFATAAVASCGGGEGGGLSETGIVSRVGVTPPGASISVPGTQQLTAVAYDASGKVVSGTGFSYQSSNSSVATVSTSGLVTAIAPGASTVTVAAGSISTPVLITVLSQASGNAIDVNPGVEYQTIVGWEGAGTIGEVDCNPTAVNNYQAPVMDRLANEIGINRVRLHLRSGSESPTDYFAQFRSGAIDFAGWKATWYTPVNDNSDPSSANPAGFQWSFLDYQVDKVVNPLRAKLQARGEKLYVNLNYVDFYTGPKPWLQMKEPAEYAEFIATAFQHLQQKYGWVPDALEMILEPDNTTLRGNDIGAAMVATAARLHTLGFDPDFIAPSTTSMASAVTYYDAMIQVPGVPALIKELSYHRYSGVSDAALQQIAQRGSRDHVRTSMLEHIGSGIDDLWQDLTVGNVSSWQQFTLAYCGNTDDPSVGGSYLQVNQSSPASPHINVTTQARWFHQIFLFVRAGAVRVGVSSSNSALQAMAFRNANGKYVTIVRAPNGSATFTIRGLPAGTYGVKYTTSSQYNIDGADVTVGAGGNLTTSIPADGIITVYAR